MRSYEAARKLYSFLEACAWIVIVFGAIVALVGGTAVSAGFGSGPNTIQAIVGAAPGIALSFLGFYGLVTVQMGRTGVDSAEYGQQSLQIAREQLELSRQAFEQGRRAEARYPVSNGAPGVAPPLGGLPIEPDAEAPGPSYAERQAEELTAATDVESQPTELTDGVQEPALPEPPVEVAMADMIPDAEAPLAELAEVPEPEPEPIEQSATNLESELETLPEHGALEGRELAESEPEPSPEPKTTPASPPRKPTEIRYDDGRWTYGSLAFSSEEAARRYVGQLGVNPNFDSRKT